MHNFKKIAVSAVSVLLIFVLVSAAMMIPYLQAEYDYYQDSRLRGELAGEIECVALGSSQIQSGILPAVLDQQWSCTSYNLSNILMTTHAKTFFLEKEIARNPVDTVILELSYDTLRLDAHTDDLYGDAFSFARLDSAAERRAFLSGYMGLNDYSSLYARIFLSSLQYWMDRLTGGSLDNVEDGKKGYRELESHDVSLTAEKAAETHNASHYPTGYQEKNMEDFRGMIELCRRRKIRVVVVTVPVAGSTVWNYENLNEIYSWNKDFCAENQVEYYDFNLLRDRYTMFEDNGSFFDPTHLSAEGAAVFTEKFCDILKEAETEDVSRYFYPSYEAMKADSPYMAYLP